MTDVKQSKLTEADKIRRRIRGSSSDGIEVIEARPCPKLFDDQGIKNVAVYARVSTADTSQTTSFEIQKKHYGDFVARQPGWKLVKVYADEGISGTSLRKRDAFNQMIKDCKNGGIDLIVTKSVSRFSRNVADGTKTIEDLRALNPPVGVYFENEGFYTLTNESDFPFSMIQSVAQEESRVKSASMNSSYEMRFSHGLFLTPPLLGYDHDCDGNLVINQDEALTVQLIFYMYLNGHSSEDIAQKLTCLNRRTKKGNTAWSPGTIVCVLRNERHCGDVLARKTWTPNYKTHQVRKNRGDRNQYYQRDHHSAIVSRDDFHAAQKMLENAKYGGRSFLPELRVTHGGELDGYVSVNTRWAGFTARDYEYASLGSGKTHE